MTEGNVSFANRAMEGILELSADAQIERRKVAKDSAAFQSLTGAIIAYGKAIGVLLAVQREEEFYAMLNELNLPEYVLDQVH